MVCLAVTQVIWWLNRQQALLKLARGTVGKGLGTKAGASPALPAPTSPEAAVGQSPFPFPLTQDAAAEAAEVAAAAAAAAAADGTAVDGTAASLRPPTAERRTAERRSKRELAAYARRRAERPAAERAADREARAAARAATRAAEAAAEAAMAAADAEIAAALKSEGEAKEAVVEEAQAAAAAEAEAVAKVEAAGEKKPRSDPTAIVQEQSTELEISAAKMEGMGAAASALASEPSEAVAGDEGEEDEEDEEQLLRLIVGQGRHHEAWQRSAREPEQSVRGHIQALLQDAKAPIVPSSNDGAIDIKLDWLLNGDFEGFEAWLGRFRERRRREFEAPRPVSPSSLVWQGRPSGLATTRRSPSPTLPYGCFAAELLLVEQLRGGGFEFGTLPFAEFAPGGSITAESVGRGSLCPLPALPASTPVAAATVPGIVIFSSRADSLSAWLDTLGLVCITTGVGVDSSAAGGRPGATGGLLARELLLNVAPPSDLEDEVSEPRQQQHVLARVHTEGKVKQAASFESGKLLVAGLHFLAVQSGPDAQEPDGFWLLGHDCGLCC